MKLSIFLHFYQPPNQSQFFVDQAYTESYLPLAILLKENPNLKLTINISGSLIEHLSERKFQQFFSILKELEKRGQIEIVGTSAYHAILPLLPDEEVIDRINLQKKILNKAFGKKLQLKGFFPPEMAVSARLMKTLKKLGFEYVITDEISVKGALGKLTGREIYKDGGILLLPRDRFYSWSLSFYPDLDPEKYVDSILSEKRDYLILANDAEVYGHHHKDRLKVLKQIAQNKNIQTLRLHDLFDLALPVKEVNIKKSSWETSASQIKRGNPFPLWADKNNPVHKGLWKLANLSIKVVSRHKSDNNYKTARDLLNKGLHSCQFWWASAWPWWHPDFVNMGADQLIKSIRSLEKVDKKTRIEAEKVYTNLIKRLWEKHWNGEAKRKINIYDRFILTKLIKMDKFKGRGLHG
jgi:predicted glycosyl hydrolase (DUF1957 family)